MNDRDEYWGKDAQDDYGGAYESDQMKSPPPPGTVGPSQATARGAIVLLGVVLAIGMAALAMGVGTLGLRNTEPYQLGFQAAQNDRAVIQALGQPLELGRPVTGELTLSGISGTVDLSGPIKGPDGRGTLFVTGRKENGIWTFYTLAVRLKETGEIIPIQQ